MRTRDRPDRSWLRRDPLVVWIGLPLAVIVLVSGAIAIWSGPGRVWFQERAWNVMSARFVDTPGLATEPHDPHGVSIASVERQRSDVSADGPFAVSLLDEWTGTEYWRLELPAPGDADDPDGPQTYVLGSAGGRVAVALAGVVHVIGLDGTHFFGPGADDLDAPLTADIRSGRVGVADDGASVVWVERDDALHRFDLSTFEHEVLEVDATQPSSDPRADVRAAFEAATAANQGDRVSQSSSWASETSAIDLALHDGGTLLGDRDAVVCCRDAEHRDAPEWAFEFSPDIAAVLDVEDTGPELLVLVTPASDSGRGPRMLVLSRVTGAASWWSPLGGAPTPTEESNAG